MIYKDQPKHRFAQDTEECPAERDGHCINCGRLWYQHEGWRCRTYNSNMQGFFELPERYRFLTQTMRESLFHLGEKLQATEKKEDILEKRFSDWRAWAHNRPGECACGIARADCIYHK